MPDIYVMKFTTTMDPTAIAKLREAPSFHLLTHDEHYEIWDFDYKPTTSDFWHMQGKNIRIELDAEKFLRYAKPFINVLLQVGVKWVTVVTPSWEKMASACIWQPNIVFDDFNLFELNEKGYVAVR